MQFVNYDALKIEPSVLQFWIDSGIYAKAKEKNKRKQKFYFLDGPPYTSGKVHIGTAWNKSLKDSFLRYKRMAGFDVWDRAGYDMHGLPTENACQKNLKLKTKLDIQEFGVNKFIAECKKLCIDNMQLMNQDFKRMGVWMDFDNAYQSITKEFIDGEWWLIKKAHEKGRLYQGLRTMTWCPITESALAKHELEYNTVTEDSVFVKFKVKSKHNEYLIIWTTTPWTLPFNLAIMVNPEVEYVKVKVDNEFWIVAEALANVFISAVAEKKYEIVEKFKGDKLEGLEYTHPFYPHLKKIYDEIKAGSAKTHTVLLSEEYVDTSGGTGLVHCAPGCGPEDYEVGHKNGIPPFNNIDTKGVFPKEMGKFAGWTAKKDDKKFIEALKDDNALIASTQVEHEYPHDWRYHEPVIFRTTKQWFFKVEDMKEDMVKENKSIKWVPNAAFNAFDSWLRNLRDNSISKQRYWGTPIPIWVNVKDEKDYLVIGSSKELEELSGKTLDDLHIPSVDPIEIKKNGKTYKRIPDILDVWVDAGTVSWNCLDFPQKTELMKELFPAEFILEGKDQIRGWFNLLHVASMISMHKPSFKNVYMHGFINDSLGRKMSKSLGNYILPDEVINKYGADTLRYYMIGAANPGLDLNYNQDDAILKHKNLMVLWNLHKFLIDLASTTGKNPKDLTKAVEKKEGIEEKYILSKSNSTIQNVTQIYDEYRLNEAPLRIEELFLELSRTYIQMIRDKASLGTEEEKEVVLYTAYNVLMDCLKIFAPTAPFITEQIYQNLKEKFGLAEESIHLCSWPVFDKSKIDSKLETNMGIANAVMQAILYAREKSQVSLRWPLKEVVVIPKDKAMSEAIEALGDLIKTQTNIKSIKIKSKMTGVKETAKPNIGKLGPICGSKTPEAIARLSTESPAAIIKHLSKDNKYVLTIEGSKFDLTKDHFIITRTWPEKYMEAESRVGLIYLNKEMTPALEAEGYAREVMRKVQNLRKQNGLEKTDDITLYIKTDIAKAISKFKDTITQKCGASSLTLSDKAPKDQFPVSVKEKAKEKEFEIFFRKN